MSDTLGVTPFSGYGRMPRALIRHETLSLGARMVWVALEDHASDSSPRPFPGQQALADYLMVSTRSIRTWVSELVGAGWLEVKRRGHSKTNQYTLLIPKPDRNCASGHDRNDTSTHDRNGASTKAKPVEAEPVEAEPERVSVAAEAAPDDSLLFPVAAIPKEPTEAEALAEYLADAIAAYRIEIKSGLGRPKVGKGWVTAMDRLLRLGPPDAEDQPIEPERVRRVIDATFERLPFWAENIQSAPTLRLKWTKIVTKLNAQLNGRQQVRPGFEDNELVNRSQAEKSEAAKQLAEVLRARKAAGKQPTTHPQLAIGVTQ